jgi:hypothetical protein
MDLSTIEVNDITRLLLDPRYVYTSCMDGAWLAGTRMGIVPDSWELELIKQGWIGESGVFQRNGDVETYLCTVQVHFHDRYVKTTEVYTMEIGDRAEYSRWYRDCHSLQ